MPTQVDGIEVGEEVMAGLVSTSGMTTAVLEDMAKVSAAASSTG